jgi:N-acetylglutamate synthase-like GNAT family acetyltransferase
MSLPGYQVRRAIVDDLQHLRGLWENMRLSPPELEKRLTEFQVVESWEGRLVGALGLEVAGRQGRLHSEVFSDFALADMLRGLLWERVHAVAANHGLARLWTQETAPFWKHHGFQTPDKNAWKRIPAAWALQESGWLTLQLRDEEVLEKVLEKDFARLRARDQQANEKALRRGRALKFISTLAAVVLAIGVVILCLFMLKHRTDLRPR